jgi:indole-3-glycerol phosphate synthase
LGNILDRIILEKQKEIKNLKEIKQPFHLTQHRHYSLIEHLEKATQLSVIAEYKRASPSKGIINNKLDPAEQTKMYEQNGAAAVSVLTDSLFFKGSFQDLQAVRASIDIPILCKDFIIDKIQIDLAKSYGADIVLLIAAALTDTELAELYKYARFQNLEVLMEVHDEEDVNKALKIGPRIIGINNRNLKTFEVNLEITEKLSPLILSYGAFVISESGIFSGADAIKVRDAGVNGVLVGESLMRSQDLQSSFQDLMVPIQKGAKI